MDGYNKRKEGSWRRERKRSVGKDMEKFGTLVLVGM
jgi:hypothetical protein